MGNHPAFLLAILIIALSAYVTLGYAFLTPLTSNLLNFFSVSLVSLLGLLIGLYCLAFPSQMGFNWMLFLGYNLYVIGLGQVLHFDPSPSNTIWFFAVPSFGLWIGLQLKKKKNKNIHIIGNK
jgi:hypothetical protein